MREMLIHVKQIQFSAMNRLQTILDIASNICLDLLQHEITLSHFAYYITVIDVSKSSLKAIHDHILCIYAHLIDATLRDDDNYNTDGGNDHERKCVSTGAVPSETNVANDGDQYGELKWKGRRKGEANQERDREAEDYKTRQTIEFIVKMCHLQMEKISHSFDVFGDEAMGLLEIFLESSEENIYIPESEIYHRRSVQPVVAILRTIHKEVANAEKLYWHGPITVHLSGLSGVPSDKSKT